MTNLMNESIHHRNFQVIPTKECHNINGHDWHSFGFVLIDSDLNPIHPEEHHAFRTIESAIAVGKAYTDYTIAVRNES